ncbi:AraC family transcriptional regulator [Colwellia sp. E2M01]|uniref:helix-turn-helix domain-containing protein n=1 Tax=Colwellia sp. E2M01 TaxID=2841561 RepID=UPI001C0977D1|nr:AraC family transcriptional regulator [Colwellia sp. E2M01]MBU2869855.1 AraC family transcriptional regulator [Colwellia sp. E2M01]
MIINKSWQQEHEDFNQRLNKTGAKAPLSLSAPNGLLQLAHANFDAFEKSFDPSSRLMLNLCTAGSGKMARFSDQANIEGIIKPGDVLIALPNSKAEGFFSKISMLGIAINTTLFENLIGEKIIIEDLLPAASNLHRDPLLTATMTAIWKDAETNGLTSAFFEHGLMVIINQLSNYRKAAHEQSRTVKSLSTSMLNQSFDYIESKLDSNLKVSAVANEVGIDIRSFTRAFRAATGYAPFEYLTMRRMEVAKNLLNKGHTITDIAILVGYSNPSKFSAAFRRVNGMSPTQWRALLK